MHNDNHTTTTEPSNEQLVTDGGEPDAFAEVAANAGEEWDYRYSESQLDRDPIPASIPCQLRFTESPEQDTDAFHDALEDNGFSPLDANPARGGSGTFYEGEVCTEETYERLKVLVFRGELVRIYPYDDHVPSNERLADLIEAITIGFNASVEHQPIEGAEPVEPEE